MKAQAKKKVIYLCVLFAAIFLLSLPVQAVTIGFEPNTQKVIVGDSVDVAVVISGLGNFEPVSLGAFDLDILFDPAILTFSDYQLGSYLGDSWFGEAIDLSLGYLGLGPLNIAELSFLEPDEVTDQLYNDPEWGPPYLDVIQPGSFTLATITFDAVSIGISDLIVEWGLLSNGFWYDLPFDQIDREINVAPVPEPATIFLLGTGIIGLAGFWKRKK